MRCPPVALLLVAAACSTSGTTTTTRPANRRLPAPEHLPTSARVLLSDRMQSHGQAMSDIVWSVLFLDFEAAAEIAAEIATEPKLARPVGRDASELNSHLPERFFDLQDQLAQRAEALARAARGTDAAAISRALGELSATCVDCHSTYLREPPSR